MPHARKPRAKLTRAARPSRKRAGTPPSGGEQARAARDGFEFSAGGVVQYNYSRGGKPRRKRVEFFLIGYRSGSPDDHDHEVSEARWMPLGDAARPLTYAGEREMVTRAMTMLGDGVAE